MMEDLKEKDRDLESTCKDVQLAGGIATIRSFIGSDMAHNHFNMISPPAKLSQFQIILEG